VIRALSFAALAAALASFTAPEALAADALLIRNATVHTGAAGAAPQTGTDVLVQDGKIAALGKALAAPAGARVIDADSILSEFGPASGKGDVLWRSVAACTGDVIVWIDADLESFTPAYITTLLGPLILDERIALVRATYDRTLHGKPAEGGRVTELTARPLLNLLHPHLAHIRQPLGGEYAIRRDVAESVPFETDYGVEVGLLIDVAAQFGVASITQVGLGARVHRNRPLAELHGQATQVARAVLTRSANANPLTAQPMRPSLSSYLTMPLTT
jgi:glucosyl-3-phosphoglycerate synthase